MINTRLATPADVDELVRLRGVMLSAMRGGADVSGPWQENAAELLRGWLDGGDTGFAAFVVERPDEPGRLAACAVAVIHQYLGGPTNPTGRVAYVYNVATDEGYRRRGYSRACMERLLGWSRDQGMVSVDLNATVDGEPLYRSMGFLRTADPAMRLSI